MKKRLYVLLSVVYFLVGANISLAAVYKWVDEEGITHFSDAPVVQSDREDIDYKVYNDGKSSTPKAGTEGVWYDVSDAKAIGKQLGYEQLKKKSDCFDSPQTDFFWGRPITSVTGDVIKHDVSIGGRHDGEAGDCKNVYRKYLVHIELQRHPEKNDVVRIINVSIIER